MTAAAGRPEPYFQTVSTLRRTVDLAVLAALMILALLGFQRVYGGVQYLLTGVMALAFALLIALIAARWRWGILRTFPAVLGVYVVFGAMFAAPTHALWGILPTPSALLELLRAPVTSWKSALTIAPPVGSTQGVLAVVWISVLLLGLFGATVVLRTRFYVVAWLFPLALLAVSIVFGTDEHFAPVIRGVLFAIISIAWLTWRYEGARLDSAQSTIISDTVRPGSWKNPVLRRRVIGGALIMALASGGAIAAQSLLDPPAGTARYALRDTVSPPFDPDEYVSPLTKFRGYIKNQRATELFTISGAAPGEYVRLATMDQYDHYVYNVAGGTKKDEPGGAFLRTASGVDMNEPSAASSTVTVTVGEYDDVWMPTLGERTDRVDVGSSAGSLAENLYVNQQTQTAVHATGFASGDSYELTYEPYTAPTAEEQRTATFAPISLEENAPMDGSVKELAEEWAGTSDSDWERFASLSGSIKTDAYYSHGIGDETASLSGHGSSRLLAMLEDVGFDESTPGAQPMGRIGDEEQFAALTAVMAREIGIPARVVMGFQVPEGAGGTASITGEDVTAWVEVNFEGLGWVRFDPAPDEDEDPTQPEPKETETELPQVAQPPPPPAEPPTPPPGATSEDPPQPPDPPEAAPRWLVYTAIGVSPLLLVGVLLGVIAGAKYTRRRRRRMRGTVPARVDGGWQELLDTMTDMGSRPDPMATRSETAQQMDALAPGVGAARLAGGADRVVFGPEEMTDAAADEYWTAVLAARGSLRSALPWHRRMRELFSLRSFRRRWQERWRERRQQRANEKQRAAVQRRAEARTRRRSPMSGPAGSRTSRSEGR